MTGPKHPIKDTVQNGQLCGFCVGFKNLRHTKGYNDMINFPTAPIDYKQTRKPWNKQICRFSSKSKRFEFPIPTVLNSDVLGILGITWIQSSFSMFSTSCCLAVLVELAIIDTIPFKKTPFKELPCVRPVFGRIAKGSANDEYHIYNRHRTQLRSCVVWAHCENFLLRYFIRIFHQNSRYLQFWRHLGIKNCWESHVSTIRMWLRMVLAAFLLLVSRLHVTFDG